MDCLRTRTLTLASTLEAIAEAASDPRTAKFVNLITPKEKAKYVDTCWELLQKAYAEIGGFQSAASPEHLIADSYIWKLNTRNGKVVAVAVYKSRFGRKGIGYATDTSSVGRSALTEIFREDFTRAWVECSGAVEAKLLKMGGAKYMVPNTYAEELTGKSVELDEDGFHYIRPIGGVKHRKVIIGTPTGISIQR